MSQPTYRLYPPGTLGRVFIDLALTAINSIKSGTVTFNDYLVINSVSGFIDAVETIRASIISNTKINPFPTTRNDNTAISNKIPGFNKVRPDTAIDYTLQVLRKGGYNLLAEQITAPSLMRLEFYEYSKRGYASYGGFKEHPYRRASLMDFMLAVTGSYLAVSARLENKLYYLIPAPYYIDLNTISSLKNTLRETINNYLSKGKELDAIALYKLVREIRRLGKDTQPVIGDLLIVEVTGNRYVFGGLYKLTVSAWTLLLDKLDNKTLSKLDTIVEATDKLSRGKDKVPPTYNVIAHLYRYVNGFEEALYHAIRELGNIAENLERTEKGLSAGDEWVRLYNAFKSLGVTSPSKLLNVLASELAELGREEISVWEYVEI